MNELGICRRKKFEVLFYHFPLKLLSCGSPQENCNLHLKMRKSNLHFSISTQYQKELTPTFSNEKTT